MTGGDLAGSIRRSVIEQSKRAGAGHIGSALSIVEILAALYGGVLRGDGAERDRFVLSKGHAALALYGALHATGRIDAAMLDTFCGDSTMLGAHPEAAIPGVDFSTGSLGQGLSVGAGVALAARMQGSPRRAFVLVSDAECNEGAIWEAAMFAGHHRLAGLVAIVDRNGQQALGFTKDVIDLPNLGESFRSFGWDVHEADGHDVAALTGVLEGLDTASGPPHVVLAETVCGKGVSFMEREIPWHYRSLSEELYDQAIAELDAAAR